ncbi:MAG: NUDIX hydrolase [Candidatus Omnitrophota bacterium]|jgi:ADP-ribose pyrophosphatase|nr:MAG: NUDIX hydrolase [Candidatus Omnitrophota bacterium]
MKVSKNKLSYTRSGKPVVLSGKALFKGKLLNLHKASVNLPTGYAAELEIIKHPGAALVVPVLPGNKIVMLRQFRPVIGKYIYELPAGTLEKGENPLSCARREIEEETGYHADKFKRLGTIFPVPGYSTEKIEIFKATGLKKRRFSPERDEVISVFVVTKLQIRELLRKGKLVDAKTICAFCLCGWI